MQVHAGVLRVLVCLSRVHVWRARACALSLFLGMLLLLFEDKTEINYISVAMRGAPDLTSEPLAAPYHARRPLRLPHAQYQ